MKQILILCAVVTVVLSAAFVFLLQRAEAPVIAGYRDTTFMIDGQPTTLSSSGDDVGTRYFGNDLVTDLNGDGMNDIVFLVTQQSGGSGTFYYVVGAVREEDGYRGTDGYFLGDRIAPQTIEVSPNPRHERVVVVNYMDRGVHEPMSTPPSMGKSAYLKLDAEHMQWGIVMPDFEGESRGGI